jgi:nucleoside-diphosphate-sugar epimerase
VIVAVTGGRGFIGEYVCNELKQRGHDALCLDRKDGFDVLESKILEELEYADAVIHLAGVLGTDELFDEAERALDVNVKGTYRVLKACADFDLHYIGITMPQCWDNIYQATKLAAGKIAHSFMRYFDVPVSHVRAFNVFGPGQHLGKPQKIIPTFADCAWRKKPIPIWGDGDQLVDLVYVEDVARMLIDALAFGDGQVFDAGTGIPFTVNQVAEMVSEITGFHQTQHLPMRRGEHGLGVRAEGEGWDLLGWKPVFRETDLVRTIESYMSHSIS